MCEWIFYIQEWQEISFNPEKNLTPWLPALEPHNKFRIWFTTMKHICTAAAMTADAEWGYYRPVEGYDDVFSIG